MLSNNEKPKGKFINILADGKMRLSVPEGTEGAEKREYETSDGKSGVKHELVFTELTGLITDIKFWEGDYGKLIQVTVVDGEEEPVILSISASQNFGEDLMKKLPNVDLKKEVKLVPFSFEDDKKKKHRGITIYQSDIKVENFYRDEDAKKNINGYPNPKAFKKDEKISKTYWRKFFSEANEFLIEDTCKRFKIVEDEKSKDF